MRIWKKSCNFAAQNNLTRMKDYSSKESALKSTKSGTGFVQQDFFTADEAIAFMEPRIRSMFK